MNYGLQALLLILCQTANVLGFWNCFHGTKLYETQADIDALAAKAPLSAPCASIISGAFECFNLSSKPGVGQQKLAFGCGDCKQSPAKAFADADLACTSCNMFDNNCNSIAAKVVEIKKHKSCLSSSSPPSVYCDSVNETCAAAGWTDDSTKNLTGFVGCKKDCVAQIKDKKTKHGKAVICIECDGEQCKVPTTETWAKSGQIASPAVAMALVAAAVLGFLQL